MRYRSLFRSLFMAFVFALFVSAAFAQVDITTWQGSLQHTGLNSSETVLTPANVGATGSFGLLFTQQTDGQTYGQPLYVSSNTSNGLPGTFPDGRSHNVVYVATEAGSLYAFDADADPQVVNPNGTNSSPLWHDNLIPSGSQPVPQSDVGSSDILGNLSITTTPVIDKTSGTIYIVVKVKNPAVNPPYQQFLYALDLKTGNPKFGSPVLVNPSFTGIPPAIGAGDLDPEPSPGPNKIPFSPLHEHTRAAMVLYNGVVYISYASHSDTRPYYGEILGYDAQTLQLVKTFNTTPNNTAQEAGIWQSGAGPAIDAAGNMYVVTGNGTLDNKTSPNPATSDWGESVLKLPTNTTGEIGLAFSDTTKWFTPNNWATLGDMDLGAGGMLLLPDQTQGTHHHIMVGGGKAGILYVLDRDNLGGVNPNDSSAIQEIDEPGAHQLFLTPSYFNGNIYYAPSGGHLEQRQVQFDPATGNYVSPTAISSADTYGNRGTSVFISANGTSNGIVWILSNALRAYDATNVSNSIFSGNTVLPTQGGGTCTTTKFSLPIVANGKVYLTCFNTQTNVGYLQVSGLFPPQAGSPPAPSNTTAAAKSASQITVSWTNNATTQSGFNFLIKRSTSATGTFTAVGSVPANVTTFTDSELNSSTTYFYEIVASNGANSNPSNVASATTFPTYSSPGLVAYWNMDDGTSTNNTSCPVNVFDVSGNGHSGTSCGEAAFTASGYVNGGWVFHGTTAIDRIVVPNNAALQFGLNQSFTLSAWINPVAFKGAEQTIIAKSADQGNEYGIYINAANEWIARGPSGDLVGPAAALNTWTHVALVQDGTAGTRSLYVNGVLEASGPAQAADGAGDLWMGMQNTSNVEGYQGLVDEVRLYNIALTPEQVTNALASPVIDVVSSQTQGRAGTFGITLFPATAPQTEPRSGSVSGTYNLFLHFAAPVTGITASLGVQPGITQPAVGQVSSVTYDSTNTVVTVELTGVQDIQALNLHLDGILPTTAGASIAGTADVPFDILQGDVTGDHVVNQFDAAAVQANFTNQVSQNNFIYDLNSDGAVNTSDANLITSSLNGHSLAVQTDANLTLFKPAFASTVNGGNVAANAFDNNTNTRWESVQGASADPSWIYVDLGAPANVHSIAINWENASAKVYDLQWSNDASNWNEIVNIPNNPPGGRIVTSGPLNFPAARYIRMFGTRRNTTFGYSMFEFQVFGSFAQATAAPTITSPLTATGTVGTAFSYQITGSQSPTTFGATGLPAGLSVSSSGLISGTPATAGTSAVTISASNAAGTGSATLNLTINNPSVPQPPAGLTAVAGNGQIALSWAASTGATSYSVFRGTASGAEGTTPLVANLTGTSFVDTSVTTGTTYFYFVKAANAAGSSAASNEVSGTSTATVPATPSNLTVLAGNAQVTLSWNASTGATSYNVYRGTTAGGEGMTPIATGITATSFVDTPLTNGVTYFYKVAAVNSVGTSALSNETSATPQLPQTGAAVYQINAGGAAVAPFVADKFFTNGGVSTTGNKVSTVGVANAAPMAVYQDYRLGGNFTYTLPGLTPGASYTVRLHFAETFFTAAGKRQFNVAINGNPVLTNFDIFATAGGQNIAVVKTFSATANSSGQIVVSFTAGAADLPRLNGLELLTQ